MHLVRLARLSLSSEAAAVCWKQQWRQRHQARRLAAAEGWTYAAQDPRTCPMGERELRGSLHEDNNDGHRPAAV